jgi:hypothetical protein
MQRCPRLVVLAAFLPSGVAHAESAATALPACKSDAGWNDPAREINLDKRIAAEREGRAL